MLEREPLRAVRARVRPQLGDEPFGALLEERGRGDGRARALEEAAHERRTLELRHVRVEVQT
ncbi:MAG: hypothetical protein ACRDM7_02380, partial [Thermoleophilaceae bacterium]